MRPASKILLPSTQRPYSRPLFRTLPKQDRATYVPYKNTTRPFTSSVSGEHPRAHFYRVNLSESLKRTLAEIDVVKETIRQRRALTNGNLVKIIQDKLRFTWTYHSNAIEGNKLTLGDTIFFLQEGLTVGGKPLKDFLDTQNHSEAIEYLYEVVTQKIPINATFLKSLNALLLKGVDTILSVDAHGNRIQKQLLPGQYKKDPNYVLQPDNTIHTYVEPEEVSYQVDELCEWITESEKKYHPVVIAGIAHYNFVRIHPFQDGNGRCGRLLMNFLLMREHYYPGIIEVEKRRDYLNGLKVADKGHASPIIQFTADAVQKTQTMVLEEIDRYLASKVFTHTA